MLCSMFFPPLLTEHLILFKCSFITKSLTKLNILTRVLIQSSPQTLSALPVIPMTHLFTCHSVTLCSVFPSSYSWQLIPGLCECGGSKGRSEAGRTAGGHQQEREDCGCLWQTGVHVAGKMMKCAECMFREIASNISKRILHVNYFCI